MACGMPENERHDPMSNDIQLAMARRMAGICARLREQGSESGLRQEDARSILDSGLAAAGLDEAQREALWQPLGFMLLNQSAATQACRKWGYLPRRESKGRSGKANEAQALLSAVGKAEA